MTEKKKAYRLFKVAKELNVGSSTLVEHLQSNGFAEVKNSPNEKLSTDMYDILLKEFASDQTLKEKAEQLREKKKEEQVQQEEAPTEEEEFLSAEQLRSGIIEPKTTPDEEAPAAEEEPKEEGENGSGLKVVGKIDLSGMGGKGRKKAEPATPPVEEKQEEPVAEKEPEKKEEAKEEPVKVEAPKKEKAPKKEEKKKEEAPKVEKEEVVEAPAEKVEAKEDAPAEEESKVIRASDHGVKLEGLKVMGKIELPTAKKPAKKEKPSEGDGDDDASKKRKRKRKRKRSTSVAADSNKGRGDRSKTSSKGKKEEPTEKEIQEIIKKTLANIDSRTGRERQRLRRKKRDEDAEKRRQEEARRAEEAGVLEVTEFITANELANLLDIQVTEIITKCMELGMVVSINQRLEADIISLLAEEYGYQVNFVDVTETDLEEDEEEELEDIEHRPPIVTVMGHVDHGKTSLLDHVRGTNVIAGEAGGITQHIGAYQVTLPDDRKISFLDTPGHEAFTAMRARGAKATDVAIIVIAADDAVMPQTKEAINHAEAAGVPIVFAFNKIDKPGANADKIREQLASMNYLTEDWGGKYQCQEISAKKGTGIEDLLEKVLLEAEMLELKANAEKDAQGTVIEARLDKGRGVVATLLVQNGTLRVGDSFVAGVHFGRVKALMDARGNRVKEAGPSIPVQILGLTGTPQAGDTFKVYKNERKAKEIAQKRSELYREQQFRQRRHPTFEDISRRKALGDFKELNIIVKADVDGSAEALADSLLKLSTDEVVVNIVMKGVGQLSESDILLASASSAVVIGFQVRPSAEARKLAENEGIEIRLYSIIYDAINDVKDAMEGMLSPEIKEEIMGSAEIREVFKISKVGTIAGCMVVEGTISRPDPVRLIRDGIVIYDGHLASLKRFKDDVKEVRNGFECGMGIEKYNDLKIGDIIESYRESEVKRKLK